MRLFLASVQASPELVTMPCKMVRINSGKCLLWYGTKWQLCEKFNKWNLRNYSSKKIHLLTIGSASAVNLSLNTLTASSVSTFNMARTRQAEPLTNPSCWYWADHINWDMIFSLTTPISASASIAAALTLCEWSSDIRSRRPSITSWSENLSCPAPWTIWIVRIMMELVDKIQQNHDVPCSPIYRIPRFTGLHKK